MMQIDIVYVLQKVGGPKKLLALFDKHMPGHDLRYPAVQMWHSRKKVSGQWAPSLLYVLVREQRIPLLACFNDENEFSPK